MHCLSPAHHMCCNDEVSVQLLLLHVLRVSVRVVASQDPQLHILTIAS